MWVDDELWLNAGRWVSRLAPHYSTIITINEFVPLSQNCLPIELAHILEPETCAIVVPISDLDRLPLAWISEIDTFRAFYADASFVVLAKQASPEFEELETHASELLAMRERILSGEAVRPNHVDRDLSSAADGDRYGLLITASMTGNCGDKLLAAAAVDTLYQANPDLKWIVADPAVDRQLVARSTIVVLGPGGYLYDLHNFEGNTLYYQNIGNFFRFGFLAQEYGKPLISLGLGYQGVVSKITAKYVSRSLSRALLITTRDAETARFIIDHLAPSPALISGDDFSLQFREQLASLAISRPSSPPYIVICGNAPFSRSDTKLIAAACQSKGLGIHLVIQAAEDTHSCEDCLRQLQASGADAKIVDLRQALHTEFMAEIAHSSAVITSRFHGMMLGYMSNLPVFVKGEMGDKRHRFYSTVLPEETFVFGNAAGIVAAFQSSISRTPTVPDRPLAQQLAGISSIRKLVQASLSPFLEACPPRPKMQLTPTSSGPMETTLDQRQQLDDMSSKIATLKSLVNEESQPNINALSEAIRNVNVLALNVKFFGYELARALAAALPVRENLSPTSVSLKSKPSTQVDLESDWVAYWASKLKVPVIFHRKLWELCYAMQAFHNAGVLAEGKRGLGFGCGTEPLPSLMASYGAEVVVTDLQPEAQNTKGWADTNQHTKTLDVAFKGHLVSREVFDRKVSLEYVDMNAIPSHLRDFDFCWSICALEHLGSIDKGLNFIENSIDVLKPGGVAVHTTEFNFSRDDITFDNWNTVLFQRKHLKEISDRLTAKGYKVAPLDFDVGNKPLDKFIDVPPFPHDMGDYMREIWGNDNNHIKVSVDGIPATCFGLIITK